MLLDLSLPPGTDTHWGTWHTTHTTFALSEIFFFTFKETALQERKLPLSFLKCITNPGNSNRSSVRQLPAELLTEMSTGICDLREEIPITAGWPYQEIPIIEIWPQQTPRSRNALDWDTSWNKFFLVLTGFWYTSKVIAGRFQVL